MERDSRQAHRSGSIRDQTNEPDPRGHAMHINPDPYVQRLVVRERQTEMRQVAHRARLRREAKHARRRERAGPGR